MKLASFHLNFKYELVRSMKKLIKSQFSFQINCLILLINQLNIFILIYIFLHKIAQFVPSIKFFNMVDYKANY
jgi:hypothetical protein